MPRLPLRQRLNLRPRLPLRRTRADLRRPVSMPGGRVTAVLGVLSLFCLTSSQIAASGTVVATLTGIPTNVALVIAGLVVILYTTFGGMIADQVSDLVQFIIILVGLAVATPFVIEGCGGWEAVSAALPPVQRKREGGGQRLAERLGHRLFGSFPARAGDCGRKRAPEGGKPPAHRADGGL